MREGKYRKKKQETERGSAVIEAVLCLTVFIVAIFSILAFINLCRAQAMISEAVDATAKEMSQYAYFYHVSGLDSLEKDLYSKTAADREKLNNIVDSVDAIYAALNCDGTETSEESITEKIAHTLEGASASEGIEGIVTAAVTGADGSALDGGALADGINSLSDSLAEVDDPLSFCKSLLTVAGLKGSSIAKSRLIAAPMAKLLIKKHFEQSGMSADEYLKSFRIEGGMDALNFNMSTIFDPESPDDIHIILYYQMEPMDFFNFDMGTITLQKEAVTRAWLGGDAS